MSQIIAVINQKGGVGKSTTAHALGAGLILKGYSVLFVDLDYQGNLSYSMGANTKGYNALGVLERPETAKEEIQHTASGDIIASSPKLAGADKLLEDTGKEYRLKEALESLQGIVQLSGTIETVRKYCNPSLSIMGIVLTRYNARSTIRREVAEMLEQTAEQLHTKLYSTKIRECVSIVEAQAMKKPIYSYAPRSNATADYKALVAEILGEE